MPYLNNPAYRHSYKFVVLWVSGPAYVVEEHGELGKVDRIWQSGSDEESSPGEESANCWMISSLGCVNDPSKEAAPSNWSQSSIMCRMKGIVDVVQTAHWSWSKKRGNQQSDIHIPAHFQLPTTQRSGVLLLLPQEVAQTHSHQINRQSVRWQDVHVVGSVEQLGHPMEKRFKCNLLLCNCQRVLTTSQRRHSWTGSSLSSHSIEPLSRVMRQPPWPSPSF